MSLLIALLIILVWSGFWALAELSTVHSNVKAFEELNPPDRKEET